MMEKKYQLVAWTENVTDNENVKLKMLPSLYYDMQEPYFREITRCQQEEDRHNGHISPDLARRFVKVYEQNAEFEFLTGHYGDGIRWLCMAALYCVWEDDTNWTYWDTDLGHYSYFCGELRHEFTRICEKVISLVKRYHREDILLEDKPGQMMKLYLEHTKESRDLEAYTNNGQTV